MPQKTATPTSLETPMRPEIVCMTSPILSLLLESLVMVVILLRVTTGLSETAGDPDGERMDTSVCRDRPLLSVEPTPLLWMVLLVLVVLAMMNNMSVDSVEFSMMFPTLSELTPLLKNSKLYIFQPKFKLNCISLIYIFL